MESFITSWLGNTPAFAIPLLLASIGLIVSERAGVLSMGAEGYMAVGAMVAGVSALQGINLPGSVLLAALAGAALALVFGIVVVFFRAEQILSGLATMAIGIGIAGVVGRSFQHTTFPGVPDLALEPLNALPIVGQLLFSQNLFSYFAVALTLLCGWLLAKTTFGLRLKAVGEDPASADVAGVRVHGMQLFAVIIAGALCGLGGAYLSVAASNVWVDNMVAGRGWIALALVIFARWEPVRALYGALLFGAVEAILPRLQAIGFQAPVYLMGMLPYILTIAALVLSVLRGARYSFQPESLGQSYVRQDRR